MSDMPTTAESGRESALPETRKVTVGDREYVLERFSLYKGELVGELIQKILDSLPELDDRLAEYRREYRVKNAVELNRATAELRYPEEAKLVSEEAWKASENRLVLPTSPSMAEESTVAFGYIFKLAKGDVLNLLALIATPNEELADAEEGDRVDEVVKRTRDRLRHAPMAEVLNLANEAVDLARGELDLGKLPNLSSMMTSVFGGEPQEQTPNESSPDGGDESDESRSTTSSSAGSTDSDARSNGAGGPHSTEPAIERPSGSPD